MLILDIPQGSDEWLKARAGLISASNFGKILTPTGKKTDGKTRKVVAESRATLVRDVPF